MELMRRLNASGQTIVLVTHDPRVAGTAGRVVRMRDGRIVNGVIATARISAASLRSVQVRE